MATQYTDDQVRDYVANLIKEGDASGLSDFEINQNIYSAMQEFEVAPTQLDSAMGWESGVSQNWIDTTSGGTVAPAAAPAATPAVTSAPVDTGVQTPAATSEGITDASIFDYLTQNPNLTDAEIAEDMDKYGVSAEQMSRVTGVDAADIQARYDAVQTPAAAPVNERYQAVTDWLTNNPNATDVQIAAQMDATGYTPEEVAAATNMDVSEIQARYDAATNAAAPAATTEGVTDATIFDYLTQNPNLTDAQIAADMDKYGVSVDQMARATGIDAADIQTRYDAATTVNEPYQEPQINTRTNETPALQPVTYTDQEVKNYVDNLVTQGKSQGLSDFEINQQIFDALGQFGVSNQQLDSAMGWGAGTTQNWIDTTQGGTVAPPQINPITNLPAVDTGTGGTGGTGGIIGSQPSGMLTPFQQAALAQNQALLGTMEASAGPFGRLATTDYNRYMNPYTTGVINATMQDLERQRQMQQNDIGYQATQAGAFGGSRHGVAEALTNEAMQRTMANTAAQQRQAGFQQAQGAAQQDIGNEMTQRQFGLTAANQMGNLAAQSFNAGTSINDMMSQAGLQQQALNQAQIDAAKGQYGAYQTYPATGAGTFAQILGAAPTGMNQTTNPGVMDYLTLGASGLGAAAQAGWISDIRVKKNITKIGELKNGVGIYTWDWTEDGHLLKSEDQPSYGVIAQEAMEVIPSAVTMASDGYYRVDYSHPELSGVA